MTISSHQNDSFVLDEASLSCPVEDFLLALEVNSFAFWTMNAIHNEEMAKVIGRIMRKTPR